MATAPKVDPALAKEPPAPTVDQPAPLVPEYRMIATVYGVMHDPHTGLTFTLQPTELLKHSGWIDSQVEAGKMVYVD